MANEHPWLQGSEEDPNVGSDVEFHAFTLSGKVPRYEEAEQDSQPWFEARQAEKREKEQGKIRSTVELLIRASREDFMSYPRFARIFALYWSASHNEQVSQPDTHEKESQPMRRPIAHCDRCRRWRYCKPVHFHTAWGQTLKRTWLCRSCCCLMGVTPAHEVARRSRLFAESGLDQLVVALAQASQSAIRANPDGTITCIWITPGRDEEE